VFDGECGSADNFCAETRNIILLTQMIDWVDWAQNSFLNNYLHADTDVSSYLVVDGTSNPMDGVSESIFDSKDYATDTAGTYYMDRPCGIKATGDESTGAFWMDVRKGESDGHEYHAVQFPVDDYVGPQTHKAFTFAGEIGVFNIRSERADFFATILDWMEVEEEICSFTSYVKNTYFASKCESFMSLWAYIIIHWELNCMIFMSI
jgi:hypothetical protein